MKLSDKKIDMLKGPLAKSIFLFTIPIAVGSIIQQLFNSADTWVVGFFSSSNALAAVGTNAEIIAMIVTVSSGLSVGANIAAAKCIGKGKKHELPFVSAGAVLLAAVVGIAVLLLGQRLSLPLLNIIKVPDSILPSAQKYLQIYFLGYPFLLLYDFCAAILRAVGNSRYPFAVIVISGAVNLVFNIFFVTVFHLDVVGVAIATDISCALSAVLLVLKLRKEKLLEKIKIPAKEAAKRAAEILKTGVPSALSGAVFCFANIFVQASVNTFGPAAIAGSTVAVNFEYFVYYIITAFGQTAATFTGQNHAAENFSRCKKITGLCLLFSVALSLAATAPIIVFREFFAGLFSSDPAVIQNAVLRTMCILLLEPMCGLYEIPGGTLRGSGHATLPALCTVVGTCLFRIVWIFTVFAANPSLSLLYRAFPLSWLVTTLLTAAAFIAARPFAAADRSKSQ